MSQAQDTSSFRAVKLLLLAWLIPGAAHVCLGHRARGAIFFVTITTMFLIGLIIGGANSTIDFQNNRAWFFAQIITGGYAVITYLIDQAFDAMHSYGKTLDLAVIYTGIAGLLNLLVVFDVLDRLAAPEKESTQGQ